MRVLPKFLNESKNCSAELTMALNQKMKESPNVPWREYEGYIIFLDETVLRPDGTKVTVGRYAYGPKANAEINGRRISLLKLISKLFYDGINIDLYHKMQEAGTDNYRKFNDYIVFKDGSFWHTTEGTRCMPCGNAPNSIILSRKTFLIKQVMAFLFLNNPKGYTECRYINGDNLDNRIENIEWGRPDYMDNDLPETELSAPQKKVLDFKKLLNPEVKHAMYMGYLFFDDRTFYRRSGMQGTIIKLQDGGERVHIRTDPNSKHYFVRKYDKLFCDFFMDGMHEDVYKIINTVDKSEYRIFDGYIFMKDGSFANIKKAVFRTKVSAFGQIQFSSNFYQYKNLLAKLFHEEPDQYVNVYQVNGNKKDFRAENIRYGTTEELYVMQAYPEIFKEKGPDFAAQYLKEKGIRYREFLGYTFFSDGGYMNKDGLLLGFDIVKSRVGNERNNSWLLRIQVNKRNINLHAARIMAMLFVDNPNRYHHIGYVDGDRRNHAASNLYYIPKKINNQAVLKQDEIDKILDSTDYNKLSVGGRAIYDFLNGDRSAILKLLWEIKDQFIGIMRAKRGRNILSEDDAYDCFHKSVERIEDSVLKGYILPNSQRSENFQSLAFGFMQMNVMTFLNYSFSNVSLNDNYHQIAQIAF